MTPEEKSLLEQTHKLAQENNTILLSIRRTNRLSVILRVCYWAVILFLSFGAYYFIQPYITTLMGAFGAGANTAGSVSGSIIQAEQAAKALQDLLK